MPWGQRFSARGGGGRYGGAGHAGGMGRRRKRRSCGCGACRQPAAAGHGVDCLGLSFRRAATPLTVNDLCKRGARNRGDYGFHAPAFACLPIFSIFPSPGMLAVVELPYGNQVWDTVSALRRNSPSSEGGVCRTSPRTFRSAGMSLCGTKSSIAS